MPHVTNYIDIWYNLSRKGQLHCMLEGLPSQKKQHVPASVTPELLEFAVVHDNGEASITIDYSYRYEMLDRFEPRIERIRDDVLFDTRQDEASLLKWLQDDRKREEASKKAAEDALAIKEEELSQKAVENFQEWKKNVRGEPMPNFPWLPKELKTEHHALLEQSVKERDAARQARMKKEEEERAARKQAELEEATTWIQNNECSIRLKKILGMDLLEQSMGVYRDERLAAEWPGWEWDFTDKDDEIHNPSLEALEAYQEVLRNKDKDAELCWSRWENGTCQGAVIRSRPDWANGLVATKLVGEVKDDLADL